MGSLLQAITSPDLDAAIVGDAVVNKKSAWIGHVPFGHWLVYALKPKILVELGTHYGTSLDAFNSSIAKYGLDTKVWAVDTWEGDSHAGLYDGNDVFSYVQSRVDNKNYNAFCTLARMNFEEALGLFEDDSIDLLHIDGLHTYEAVKNDFETWLPKLSSRAIVLFHDTEVLDPGFGVKSFWEEICQKYWGINFTHSNGLGLLSVGPDTPEFVEELKTSCERTRSLFTDRFARLGNRWLVESGLHERIEYIEKDYLQIRKEMWNIRGSFGCRLRFLITGR